MLTNLKTELYDQIPVFSPLRTVLIKILSRNVPSRHVSQLLDISQRNVNKCKNTECHPFSYYVNSLGLPRDKLGVRETHLLNWLDEHAPVPSGCSKRYYEGGPIAMYFEYIMDCNFEGITPVCEQTFDRIRKRERVGLHQHNKFLNQIRVDLAEKTRQLNHLESHNLNVSQQSRLKDEITSIQNDINFAIKQQKNYSDTHVELENSPHKMLVTLDFFSSQTNMTTKFTSLVCVIATKDQLQVPPTLKNLQITSQLPSNIKGIDFSILNDTVRRPRVKASQPHPKVKNIYSDNIKIRKAPKLSQNHPITTRYKPHVTYFHFISKFSDDDLTKPNVTYVMGCLELLASHGLFNAHQTIEITSDGAAKQFKNYSIHALMAEFQEKLNKKVCWNILAPFEAHNRCDAAAGHLKVQENILVRNGFIFNELTEWAFVAGKLNNVYMIEAPTHQFCSKPKLEPFSKPWIHLAFKFEYGKQKTLTKTCKCKCINKHQCLHKCCKGTTKLVREIIVTFKNGDIRQEYVSLDEKIPLDDNELTSVFTKGYITPSHAKRQSQENSLFGDMIPFSTSSELSFSEDDDDWY